MGTFLLAVRTGLPIVPVIIRGAAPLHKKNGFAVYPGEVRVDILPPIAPPRVKALELVDAAQALMRRTEALYRSIPDLNQPTGDLAPAAAAA
jgi:1-acyl-sn-glycerol-3-phosphate acyltransferase